MGSDSKKRSSLRQPTTYSYFRRRLQGDLWPRRRRWRRLVRRSSPSHTQPTSLYWCMFYWCYHLGHRQPFPSSVCRCRAWHGPFACSKQVYYDPASKSRISTYLRCSPRPPVVEYVVQADQRGRARFVQRWVVFWSFGLHAELRRVFSCVEKYICSSCSDYLGDPSRIDSDRGCCTSYVPVCWWRYIRYLLRLFYKSKSDVITILRCKSSHAGRNWVGARDYWFREGC